MYFPHPSINPVASSVRQCAAVAVETHPQHPVIAVVLAPGPGIDQRRGSSILIVREKTGVDDVTVAAAAAPVVSLPQVRLVVVEVEPGGVEGGPCRGEALKRQSRNLVEMLFAALLYTLS